MGGRRFDECVEDALADFERQGHLHMGDVQRLVDLHGLDGAGTAAVFAALRDLGIPIDGREHEPQTAPSKPTAGRSDPADTLGLMLRSAGQVRLLTAEEETVLGRRISIGKALAVQYVSPPDGSDVALQIADGQRAYDRLVTANIRLVVSIARRYRWAGMELADLIQEGTIGLMRAADKFDHTLGYKFSTYATWWIRQAIQRGLADRGRLIRLPVHVAERIQGIRRTRNRLCRTWEREPTLPELAKELNTDPADVQALLDLARDPISLDAPIGDEAEADLGSVLNLHSPDVAEEVIRSLLHAEIRTLLKDLAEHQSHTSKGASAYAIQMLKMRYGLDEERGRTLEEIGGVYGITRERVRQILDKIVKSPEVRAHLAPLVEPD